MILRFLVLLFDIRCLQSHAIISENILCFKWLCMPAGRRKGLQPGVTVLTILRTNRMAERVGFEPTVPGLAEHTISSRAPSANSGISPHFLLSAFSLCPTRLTIKFIRLYSYLASLCFPAYSRKLTADSLKLAERVGFEPTCPALHRTSRFRVDPVTTTSVPLRKNHRKCVVDCTRSAMSSKPL